ncbi:hypothetical protein [Brevibacillus fulvus]|uniref:Heme/copper-type cytochrome/quinol oxidase subunit 3 n=1 Tax=Brevibacillus fulvus TaxID=1125967 RepID=A0A938XXD4_9BACL|nr:hypothetical protein [Brevibacillus fulvus]MBM7592238.1 heme/copper-type cytochrome/quinol oxidase subunit 3 [Brevibacillus fulvus]
MRSSRRKKTWEFSKLVLALVMATYFFGVLFGAYIVYRSTADPGTTLASLLTFIGGPTAVAIPFYLWKAKNENMQKHGEMSSLTDNAPVQNEEVQNYDL